MRELIRDLAGRATVILSTHIMQEVDALCDRVLVLSGGALALDASMGSLRESRHLLLTCSDDKAELKPALERMAQIARIETQAADAGQLALRLALHGGTAMDTAAGHISRAVIEAGARLYRLAPEQRDLEQIFRESVQSSGGRHAA